MKDELQQIEETAKTKIEAAASLEELEERRVQFLGREHGAITLILRQLKNLTPENRRVRGEQANRLRTIVEALIAAKTKTLKKHLLGVSLQRERIDVTRPGIRSRGGHLHPLTKLIREIETIFGSLGFTVAEGPEVETEFYNFDALNIPEHHPARDMWDTFWIKGSSVPDRRAKGSNRLLLRTHTSPVQIRYLESHNPPLRIIVPGRAYRFEATDATHEIQFHQLEGLWVDHDVSIAHFKAILEYFFSRLFGKDMEVRLRPSYFPFVEPGFEVDMKPKKGKRNWLEISGAGMVHPHVFTSAGLNPKEWRGFAFGMGIERLAMLKYKIPDIRLFHAGDLRFLKQF